MVGTAVAGGGGVRVGLAEVGSRVGVGDRLVPHAARSETVRLKTIWPFPEALFSRFAERVRAFVIVEINLGQIALEVERIVRGRTVIRTLTHAGGRVHQPERIEAAIEEVLR